MRLRRADRSDRTGLVRTARIDREVDQLVARANPGDIAVIDVVDLDRGTAEQLVSAGVSAVVNAAASCSGRFPVHGAQTLLEAGVLLVDDVGGEVFARVRDGDTVRLDGAAVYAAGHRVVEGSLQDDASVAAANAHAHDGLHQRVGALIADAGRRLTTDDGRMLEGDGFPPLIAKLRDRVVVVITSAATKDELALARRLTRRGATVIAVGTGADLARTARIRVDLLVLGRPACSPEAIARAREVLVLDGAELDSPVPTGIPRAHAAPVGSPEDTAVLLAYTRAADLVVTCGLDETLGGVLDRSVAAGSVPLVGRLRGGGSQVSADAMRAAVAGSRRGRPVLAGVLTLVVVVAVSVAAIFGLGLLDSDDNTTAAPTATAPAADQAADAALANTVAPALIAGRLQGHGVALVALPGAGSTTAIANTLRQAGAAVDGPIVIKKAYLDPARARVLRDLAAAIAPAATRTRIAAQPAGTDPATQLDEIVASSVAAKTVTSTIGGQDVQATTLLSGLSRLDALSLPAAGISAGDLVVLVAPAGADPATTARSMALAGAFARHARAVVVVTPDSASGASSGVVGAIREVAPPRHISSVDGTASTAGRLGTVLALRALTDGAAPGDYGLAGDADAVVPGTAPPS